VEYFAFSLILAGGLGNFIDRVTYGFVIDFIDISFNPYIFNLADSYVTIGILIYIIKSLFFNKENESHKIS
jgi:signal peptidase II